MRASGNATGISLESFMTKAGGEDAPVLELMPTEPLFAISVKFEDQTGKEVKQLPYRISVRGIVNFDDARQQTAMGANPGQFGSGQTLFQEGITGDITLEQPGRENWTGQSLGSELPHFLYAYKATGEEKDGRFPWPPGNVKISISPPGVRTAIGKTHDCLCTTNPHHDLCEEMESCSCRSSANPVVGKPPHRDGELSLASRSSFLFTWNHCRCTSSKTLLNPVTCACDGKLNLTVA